tara:strand:- start:95 stop:319 length:225 start_codon:yes stop_codon:yes gene_type:complete
MKHIKFLNKIAEFEDPSEVMAWVQKELKLTKIPIMCQLNYDGTIRQLEIGKSLTKADKDKLLSKFPELVGKEID